MAIELSGNSIFLKSCIGSIKILLQLLLKNNETEAIIQDLGVIKFSKRSRTLEIKLDHMDNVIEDCLSDQTGLIT